MTIFICRLDSERFAKIDEDQITHHYGHSNQAKCDVEPIQANAVNPGLKSKNKDRGDNVPNEGQCNNGVRNYLGDFVSASFPGSRAGVTYISIRIG